MQFFDALAQTAPGAFTRGKTSMRHLLFSAVLLMSQISEPLLAQEASVARPNLLLREVTTGMPQGELQEIRVLTATLQPGDQTVFHTHRHPVTVYILEGEFTLEKEGQAPVTVRAGESMVEPPNVKMTGHNLNTTTPMRVVIFYVSEPDSPFLNPIQ